jgi:cyclase
MKFTRKQFIKTSAIISGGMFLQTNKLLASLSADDKRFNSLRGNIGVFTEKGGSIGYYVDDDALVIIDTQYPDTAKNLMTGIREKTNRKIDIVFNTHHHGDHTSGNTYLKEFTNKIVAQENCPKIQRKRNLKPGEKDNLVYANVTFTDQFNADLGNEKITAFHLQAAHTGADSVIHFENANIAHLGDLVFHKVYPWFSLDDEGTFKGWISYLEELGKKFDKDTLFIFGHGQGMNKGQVTGTLSDITLMKNYLVTLVDYTQKQISAGKSEDEAASVEQIAGVTNRIGLWEQALQRNIREAYKELRS